MLAVLLTSKSHADLLSIASYLLTESGSIEMTTRYIVDLEQAMSQLSQFPLLGSPTMHPILSFKKYRFLLMKRHVIIYRVNEEQNHVLIIRILHQKAVQFLRD
jgi:toxin ParE1/3/4